MTDYFSRGSRVERALPLHRANRDAHTRLFCLPHAGGSAFIFEALANILVSNGFDFCCIELPGRGNRFGEPAIDNIGEMVAHAVEVVNAFNDLPYSLLGYSMGAAIAYEMAHWLARQGRSLPQRLFLAAASPPETRERNHCFQVLSNDDLIAKLSEYNGTPREILDHSELMKLLLPTIRADFKLIETYSPDRIVPLAVPIDAITGAGDSTLRVQDVLQWQNHTSANFNLHLIEGDHFFVSSAAERLASIIHPSTAFDMLHGEAAFRYD
jgi:medium-chain acyl-[acyl-carrier-protein] hydrolase